VQIFSANVFKGKTPQRAQYDKVPDGNDEASAYGLVEALRFLAANCKARRFGVVNMSLTLGVGFVAFPDFLKEMNKLVCSFTWTASETCGTVFVQAAGEPCEDEARGRGRGGRGQGVRGQSARLVRVQRPVRRVVHRRRWQCNRCPIRHDFRIQILSFSPPGNDKRTVPTFIAPQVCPEVILVTSLRHDCVYLYNPGTRQSKRNCEPSSFSNYL